LFETLSVDFAVRATEIKQLAPDWILVLDSVTGTGKLKASGQDVPLNGHGLYVLQKVNGGCPARS
jgi:hypothetical protein